MADETELTFGDIKRHAISSLNRGLTSTLKKVQRVHSILAGEREDKKTKTKFHPSRHGPSPARGLNGCKQARASEINHVFKKKIAARDETGKRIVVTDNRQCLYAPLHNASKSYKGTVERGTSRVRRFRTPAAA